MNLTALQAMFKPMMGMLKKLAVQYDIKAMVFKFDEKGELEHDMYNEDIVVMKRHEFDEMINNLTKPKQ